MATEILCRSNSRHFLLEFMSKLMFSWKMGIQGNLSTTFVASSTTIYWILLLKLFFEMQPAPFCVSWICVGEIQRISCNLKYKVYNGSLHSMLWTITLLKINSLLIIILETIKCSLWDLTAAILSRISNRNYRIWNSIVLHFHSREIPVQFLIYEFSFDGHASKLAV